MLVIGYVCFEIFFFYGDFNFVYVLDGVFKMSF